MFNSERADAFPAKLPYPNSSFLRALRTASPREAIEAICDLGHHERLLYQRRSNTQDIRMAQHSGMRIAKILEKNPPTPNEPLQDKSKRFQEIMDHLADPQAKEFTKKLQKQLESVFKRYSIQDPGIVVVGSEATGGKHFRAVAGTLARQRDLDMALVYTSHDPIDFTALQDEVVTAMEAIQPIKSEQIFIPCKKANIKYQHKKAFTAHSIKDFLSQPISSLDAGRIVTYFFPSVPPEINLRQQQIILSQLQQVAKTDRGLWQQQTDAIIHWWSLLYFIKEKYVIPSQEENEARLAKQTQQVFFVLQKRLQEIKLLLFSDLILATAISN